MAVGHAPDVAIAGCGAFQKRAERPQGSVDGVVANDELIGIFALEHAENTVLVGPEVITEIVAPMDPGDVSLYARDCF